MGGGTRDDLLPQIVADVLGREQAICHPSVGASFGSAILAADAVSLIAEGDDWVRFERVLEPAASTSESYSELYDRYRELYPRLAADMHALARVEAATPPSPG